MRVCSYVDPSGRLCYQSRTSKGDTATGGFWCEPSRDSDQSDEAVG
jgi:hypothetical protein